MAQTTKTYADGDVIFREGETGKHAYSIEEGNVTLSKDTPRGPVEIETLTSGQMFGEIGVLNGGKRTLTATAIGSVRVGVLDAPSVKTNVPATIQVKSNPTPKSSVSDRLPKQGWLTRLMNRPARVSSKIEIRVVPFSGENGNARAKDIVSALASCAGISARIVTGESDFIDMAAKKSNVSTRTNYGRKILEKSAGDLLIWGDIPDTSTAAHLHFVSALRGDMESLGAFTMQDMLPLPLDLNEAWTALLQAVALAATTPGTKDKSNTLLTHLEPAIEAGVPAAQTAPSDFDINERGHLNMCLANAIALIGQRVDEPELLGFAIETFEKVRTSISAEGNNLLWSMCHKQMGIILTYRADKQGSRADYLNAIDLLRIAADTLPRRTLSLEWAAAQNKLGHALYKVDITEDSAETDNLNEAIQAFQSAALIYNRVEAPNRWAEVMNSYALVAQVLGEQTHNRDLLQKAVSACRGALEIRKRSRRPYQWAATQNTLGSALFLLGRSSNRNDHIEYAIEAFNAARAVYEEKGALKMSSIIGKNLDRAMNYRAELLNSEYPEATWLDDPDAETEEPREEDDNSWWRDNVVDKRDQQIAS